MTVLSYHLHLLLGILLCAWLACSAAADLPAGSAPKALEFEHFPDRLHAFVWRNWNVVEPEAHARRT